MIRSHDSAWTSSGNVGKRECNRSSSRRLGDKWVIGRDGCRAVSSRGSLGVDVGSQNAIRVRVVGRELDEDILGIPRSVQVLSKAVMEAGKILQSKTTIFGFPL